MTPKDRLLVLQWVREHREYDGQDSYVIDADELEDWLLDRESDLPRLDLPSTYRIIDVPVIDGVATLPDGRTIKSTADVVQVPILNSEKDGAA